MNNPEFRYRIPRKQPDYHYYTRWCGTEGCAQMYNLQTDARSGWFISAATYVNPSDTHSVIVTHCIKCGVPINQGWADECMKSAPEPTVYRGGD